MKMKKEIQIIHEDNSISNIDVLSVDTEVFANEFEFLDDYIDVVKCLENGRVYKAKYSGTIVELFEIGNNSTLLKLEKFYSDSIKQDIY